MVTAPSPAPPPCRLGKGNPQPARKLALWPLIASTLGSARTCSRFLDCNAAMVAPRFRSGRNRKMFNALLNVTLAVPPAVGGVTCADGNCPVVTVPGVLAAPVLN